ncbi:MAG TPA: hypothetical protein PLU53_15735 [Bacteroidia bacterium]|nr:hypothetical protein [Bacteroidia bacterium]
MHIREALLSKHSRQQAEKVVQFVGTDKAKFKELMRCYLSGEKVLAQRAAMAAGYCAVEHPEMFEVYLSKILKAMVHPVHDAVVRNALQILRRVEIPESLESDVVEICFKLLTSAESPIAVKVYSMSVIRKIAQKYPELLQELMACVDAQLPYESKAFAAHVRKNLR